VDPTAGLDDVEKKNFFTSKKSVALVRKRTIPTEGLPLVG
jgi:hypothetical protein